MFLLFRKALEERETVISEFLEKFSLTPEEEAALQGSPVS